jgi:hypothetical protein
VKHKQFGGFLVNVLGVAAVVVIGFLLMTPFLLKKKSDQQIVATIKAEEAQNTGKSAADTSIAVPAPMPAPVPVTPRGIGFGLTFALSPANDKTPSGLVSLSCHGEPKQLDQPHRDSCNPYKGDTSCRMALPVLCLKTDGGVLAATQPVMGAILESEAIASARCVKELGEGWRMAEFHDGVGWAILGQSGSGFSRNTRYWIRINDQRGNCWDSTS